MLELSTMKRYRTKKGSLAISILKAIAVTGMVAIAATNPQFGPRLIKELAYQYKKKKDRNAYHSLQYLQSRGYVEFLKTKDGLQKVKITQKGKEIIKQIDIENLQLKKASSWDQRWRVVTFDVPNYKSNNRLAFTEKLKNIGFRMIQKSLWVYPYPCREEIMILRKFYDIEKYVTYLETAMVDDEERWQDHFIHLLTKSAYAG